MPLFCGFLRLATELLGELKGVVMSIENSQEKARLSPEAVKILDEILKEIRRQHSPWATREAAAAYCGCSMAEIDAAARRGDIKKFTRGSTPMFKKSGHAKSLDAWIESGEAKPSKRGLALKSFVVGKER